MPLTYTDIKQAVSALSPSQAMEVAAIAQLAVADALKEGVDFKSTPLDLSGALAAGGVGFLRSTSWIFGDSRDDQQSSGLGKTQPALNYWNHFQAITGQRIKLLGKYAVSGSKTYDLAGQIATAVATGVFPQYAVILSGVNNWGVTSAKSAADDIDAARKTLLSYGITPIIFNEVGAPSGFVTSAAIAWLFELRQRISDICDGDRRTMLYDPAPVLWDATAAGWTTTPAVVFKAGVSVDNTHTGNYGAGLLGADFATWFGSRLPPFEQRSACIGEMVNANNPLALIQNGLFTSQSGGSTAGAGTISSGTVPAGWTYNRGASAATAITYTAGAVGNDLTLAVTTSAADTVKLSQDVATGPKNALVVGDTIQATCEIEVSGATNLMGVHLIHEYNDGTSTSTFYDLYAGKTSDVPAPGNGLQAYGPYLLKPPACVLAALPAGWVTIRIEAVFSGAGGATIKVRRAALRKKAA